jgi:hypothetical protein
MGYVKVPVMLGHSANSRVVAYPDRTAFLGITSVLAVIQPEK